MESPNQFSPCAGGSATPSCFCKLRKSAWASFFPLSSSTQRLYLDRSSPAVGHLLIWGHLSAVPSCVCALLQVADGHVLAEKLVQPSQSQTLRLQVIVCLFFLDDIFNDFVTSRRSPEWYLKKMIFMFYFINDWIIQDKSDSKWSMRYQVLVFSQALEWSNFIEVLWKFCNSANCSLSNHQIADFFTDFADFSFMQSGSDAWLVWDPWVPLFRDDTHLWLCLLDRETKCMQEARTQRCMY